MIDFVYLIALFMYALLFIGFKVEEPILVIIAAMGIIVGGVYVGTTGISGNTNLMIQAFAIINIAMGAYIMLRASMEEAMEHLNRMKSSGF